MVDTLYMC